MQKLLVVLAGAAVLALTAPVVAQGTGSKATNSGKASQAAGRQVLASSFTAQ